jgi:hypothetical protein
MDDINEKIESMINFQPNNGSHNAMAKNTRSSKVEAYYQVSKQVNRKKQMTLYKTMKAEFN